MDQIKTGSLIRSLRLRRGMTQLALAERLGVSGKAVSKWECGGGAPDIALLPALAEALGVSARALLRGELEENDKTNGNLKKLLFYRCPGCGNLLFSTDGAEVHCCGQTLAPLAPREPDEGHALRVEISDGEWFLTSPHEMRREHHISFAAFHAAYLADKEKYGARHGILGRTGELPPPNAYTVSCVPWVCFQHFAVHSYESKAYYFPSVEAGKFRERDGKTLLPLSLTVHHAAADGWHVHRFLERLQEEMDRFFE